jgi:cysteinyl-tRNA synthetase
LDHRKNPETGNTYRQDMINWINTIAAHAREKDPQFLIIPQNGPQLLEDKSYLETISAIGIEDLYSNGKKLQKKDHFEYLNGFLKNLQNTEKAVYIIDYAKKEKIKKMVIDKAKKEKLSLLITDRNLTQIGETPLK